MEWLILALGFVLLISGAELLVRGAARLATNFGVPALVVGLTVVAFGTSAPELAVSIRSAWAGQAELAVANVVGSNIINVLFILGATAVIAPLIVSQQLIRQDVPIMVIVSLALVAMAWSGSITRWNAILLCVGLVVYMGFLFYQGRKQGKITPDEDVDEILQTPKPLGHNLILVVAGLVLLVVGARWLVDSAVSIASAMGVSEAVVGLTIVAAGTSLPELMTSIIAAIKGERDIAIGNVVGSNILNILSVVGVAGLVSPEPLLAGAQLSRVDLPIMLGVAVLCMPLFFTGAILDRIEGAMFLALYIAYLWYMLAVVQTAAYLPMLKMSILYGLVPVVVLYVAGSLVQDLRRRRAV